MKKMNEKNIKIQKMFQEDIKYERIENLYNQMIRTNVGDEDYRAKIVHELLQLQKADGSFSVIDDYRCDSDVRVDYIYFPTYYASAAMIFASTFDGINETMQSALMRALAVAGERHLAGHGYDETRQQIDALNIYKSANLYEFLQKYGKEFSDFNSVINSVIEGYRNRLAENRTVSDWLVDFRSEFEAEVSDFDMNMAKNVWYAAYGSNICKDRFMEYINCCTDTTAPAESKSITIEHNIYFAGSSNTWEHKGTAFLDDSCSGMTLGRMYLITSEQFAQIQHFEGPKYSKKVQLGSRDGYPIYTFTAPSKRGDNKCPSANYFNTILTGLKETYTEVSEEILVSYLMDCGIIDNDDRKILSFVRSSEHGVALHSISENTVALTRVKKSINKLVDMDLLKQDRRSIASGHNVTDNEAVFYTNKERRGVITLLLLMHR